MKISREQASLIADLQARLVEKMNVIICYSHPHMTIIPENVEYVICESEDADDDDIQLLHKEDLKIDWLDENTISVSPGETPRNDHLVEKLLNAINAGLVDGVLWFDPGITRTVDGMTIRVTKKSFNESVDKDSVFDTNIAGPNMTTMYKYSQICLAAKMDRRFKALKTIIDSNWPEVSTAKAVQIHQQAKDENSIELIHEPVKGRVERPHLVEYIVSYFKDWLRKKL